MNNTKTHKSVGFCLIQTAVERFVWLVGCLVELFVSLVVCLVGWLVSLGNLRKSLIVPVFRREQHRSKRLKDSSKDLHKHQSKQLKDTGKDLQTQRNKHSPFGS